MADQGGGQLATVNTPEKVALDLMQMIAHVEMKALHSGAADGWTSADRAWMLDTYAECIRTIREPQNRMAMPDAQS